LEPVISVLTVAGVLTATVLLVALIAKAAF
jgi:hypothetical protein